MEKLTASEALYGFCGWLTTQEDITELGSEKDCALIAQKIEKFCTTNGLEDPRVGWNKILKHPE